MLQKLKMHFKFYKVYKAAIESGTKEVTIIHCKKEQKVEVDKKLKSFIDTIEELVSSIKDEEVLKITKMYFLNRKHDKEVLSQIHIAQAQYYRFAIL